MRSPAGGYPSDVFRAICGPAADVVVTSCDEMSETARMTATMPVILATNDSKGELVQTHAYSVHGVNDTHIVLHHRRNCARSCQHDCYRDRIPLKVADSWQCTSRRLIRFSRVPQCVPRPICSPFTPPQTWATRNHVSMSLTSDVIP